MSPRAIRRKTLATTTTTVVRRAREIAETSDRWFVSVAGWAMHEADICADSAAVAFATTIKVAKKLTGLERGATPALQKRQPHSPSSRAPKRARRKPAKLAADPFPERDALPVELLAAISAPRTGAANERLESTLASHPAGVVPLLQALGRTMADHTHRGYATLEQDERFWMLIHLLQLLSRPIVPTRFTSAPGRAFDADSGESTPAEASDASALHPRVRQTKP